MDKTKLIFKQSPHFCVQKGGGGGGGGHIFGSLRYIQIIVADCAIVMNPTTTR